MKVATTRAIRGHEPPQKHLKTLGKTLGELPGTKHSYKGLVGATSCGRRIMQWGIKLDKLGHLKGEIAANELDKHESYML